jgi:hypothetical protein
MQRSFRHDRDVVGAGAGGPIGVVVIGTGRITAATGARRIIAAPIGVVVPIGGAV